MILTVDPISAIPSLGMRLSAWMSVHLIASDYTTSGNDPELATFSYNFPGSMGGGPREEYVKSIGDECRRLGVAIVGGHTGSYPGAGFTVVGTGSMVGFAPEGGYIAPSMARPGDSVLMTKTAGIEATASLARSFPVFVDGKAGHRVGAASRNMTRDCSTVGDARAARKVGVGPGGVTSMHDATEGGVLGGLFEMSSACGRKFEVRTDSIPVSQEAAVVCRAFGLDPLRTMGEGALLLTCAPDRTEGLVTTLRRSGSQATKVGEVKEGQGLRMIGSRGREADYGPGPDEYWDAYASASRRKLS